MYMYVVHLQFMAIFTFQLENEELEISPGPRLEPDETRFSILDRGYLRVEGERHCDLRHIFTLLSFYYVMDLSYPRTYGNALGLLQEFVLGEKFEVRSKSYIKEAARLAKVP